MPLLRNLKLKGIRIIVLKNTYSALVLSLLGCLVLAGGFFINSAKNVGNTSLASSNDSKLFAQGRIVSKADPIEVCGVTFSTPWFEVRNDEGSYLILIDSGGNLLINSSEISFNSTLSQEGWKNSFVIRNSSHILFAANRSIAQVYGSIYENTTPPS